MARAAEAGARLSGEVGRRVRERPAGRPSLRALPTPPAGDPPLDGSHEFADLYGEIPELSEPPALQTEPESAGRARAAGDRGGRRRGHAADRGHAAAGGAAHSVPSAAARASSLAPRRGSAAGQDHERVARILIEALANFGVEARVVGKVTGPRVTRYELQLAAGTKVSRVSQLRDDLAYALATTEIRILAPIPGKQAVGVEVPNTLGQPGDARRHLPGRRRPARARSPRGSARTSRGRSRLRPGPDAAPPDRRHHRLGQVGLHQRHPGARSSCAPRPTRCG